MDSSTDQLRTAAAPTFERIRADHLRAPQRLKIILRYVEDNLFEPNLDFQQLKQACKLRDNTLPIQFHKAIGLPPYAYIKDCRMETAARLLRDTRLKIWQICSLVGYSGIQVFSRAFLQWSDLRPSAYRRKHCPEKAEAQPEPASQQDAKRLAERPVMLRKAIQGTLAVDKAEALIARLVSLYPSAAGALGEAPDENGGRGARIEIDRAVIEEIRAETHAARLEALPREEQAGYVAALRLDSPALFHLLCKHSMEKARGDREVGVHLAKLALASLDSLAPGVAEGEGFHELRAKGWGYLANAYRLTWDLLGAERALAQAEALLPARSAETATAGAILLFKAALRWCQHRLSSALEASDRCVSLFRPDGDRTELVRALLLRAAVRFEASADESAICDVEEAMERIDLREEPLLKLTALHNLTLYLSVSGRVEEAERLVPLTRALGEALASQETQPHLRWLDGRIAVSNKTPAEAERSFEEARNGFLELGQPQRAAVVSLDLAVLLAEQGRSTEVMTIVTQIIPLFETMALHPQALAAMTLLRQALRVEQINLDALNRIRKAAERLQLAPRLVREGD